ARTFGHPRRDELRPPGAESAHPRVDAPLHGEGGSGAALMGQQPRVDPLPHLQDVARRVAEAGQPETGFRALDWAMGAVIGHKLFTILLHHPGAHESERRYTNQPAAYRVGGRKPVTPSTWTERLFVEQRPYIGKTADDIRDVFFDHEIILSLGC